ncbi:MAG TPA: Rid family detoxifying hydrolase [Chloroflexota bacterium]|nr:Rid family detoxifying hydrolase [Chloroflexota bacterium]
MHVGAGEKQGIRTANAPTPTGPFSQAIRIGNLIFVSGQAGRNRETGHLGDVREQTEWSLRNITAILAEAGATLDDVVKTTVYLRDNTLAKEMSDEYLKHFKEPLPARSTAIVGLKFEGMLVEIEAIAVVRE